MQVENGPAPIGGRKASMSAGRIAMEAHAAASHLESARTHLAALMRVVQNATPQEVPELRLPLTTMKGIEREAVRQTVALEGGNLTRAALRLGISRRTVAAILKKAGELPGPDSSPSDGGP